MDDDVVDDAGNTTARRRLGLCDAYNTVKLNAEQPFQPYELQDNTPYYYKSGDEGSNVVMNELMYNTKVRGYKNDFFDPISGIPIHWKGHPLRCDEWATKILDTDGANLKTSNLCPNAKNDGYNTYKKWLIGAAEPPFNMDSFADSYNAAMDDCLTTPKVGGMVEPLDIAELKKWCPTHNGEVDFHLGDYPMFPEVPTSISEIDDPVKGPCLSWTHTGNSCETWTHPPAGTDDM